MRVFRAALYALGFGAAFSGTIWLVFAGLDAHEIEASITRHDVAELYRARVAESISGRRRKDDFLVSYHGDSMVTAYPEVHQLPTALKRRINRLQRGKQSIEIINFGLPGTGIFDFYLLADVVARAKPDLVILPFNLHNASPNWQHAFSRTELSGWLRPGRIGEALLLPLSWAGITADTLLFNVALIQLGGFEMWRSITKQQTRMDNAKTALAEKVAYRGGDTKSPEEQWRIARYVHNTARVAMTGDKTRFNEFGMRFLAGPALDGLPEDHPTLEMLGATVRSYRRLGIETLVYVSPMNIAHINRLGMFDAERVARSVAGVQKASLENGAYFLDLHDLLSDRYFRDNVGHFNYTDEFNGTALVSQALAPAVLEIVRTKAARP